MEKTLLLAQYFPPDIGGTQTLYYHICQHLPPDKIVVMTSTCDGWEAFDQQQPFKIYRVDRFAHVDSQIFQEVWDVANILRKEQIQHIIYGHVNFCLTALILRFLLGKRYYLYVHGEEITSNFGGKYYQFFKWNALKYAKGIIAVSDFTKALVAPYNPKTTVIYNAVDTTTFAPREKNMALARQYQLEGKTVLLTLSRLEDRKGHDRVLTVLSDIVKTFPDVVYLIAGTGEYEETLKRLVEQYNLGRHVKFVGKISSDQVVDYYNLCDIFVMPVRHTASGNTEGFGIVFLEANACGKPVIGGNAGGVPSAIRDGYSGVLIDGNNDMELHHAIMTLLQDDALRETMGRQARAWAEHFTYERLVKALDEYVSCP